MSTRPRLSEKATPTLSEVFGDLGRSKPWAEAFARQLEEVSSGGPRVALHRFFDGVEA